MIEKRGREYIPVCNGCMKELPPEQDTDDAAEAMERAGWKAMPPGTFSSEWENYCPVCRCKMAGLLL